MNYQFIGDATQALMINLEPGEEIVAEAAAMLFCNQAVGFQANPNASMMGGIKRSEEGETVSLTHFRGLAPGGQIAFAASWPGKVETLELSSDAWLCNRESFLCATSGVTHEIAFARRFGAAGANANSGTSGEGAFALQRVAGNGTIFFHIGGALVESSLVEGQSLRVQARCIAAMEDTVTYEIEPGIGKNTLSGAHNPAIATLSGAGKVMLQTLPAPHFNIAQTGTGAGYSTPFNTSTAIL